MATGPLGVACAQRLDGENADTANERERSKEESANTNGRRPLHIFVLIDALGWRLLEGHDFLSDLLPYRKPLKTVLGYSSGAIPTILTGLPPAQHGHWNLLYYDPQGSPFRWLRSLRFLPDAMFDQRVTRKLLKEMGRRVLGLGSQFECTVSPRLLPFFNWTEKRNIYGQDGLPGGRSIFDQLAADQIPYKVYSYHSFSDEEVLRCGQRDLEANETRFFFLYLSELDMFLHTHCGDGEGLTPQLDRYAKGLRELFESALKLDSQASFTVFSDHGMTPVSHHCDLVREVNALPFAMPEDYLAVYDSTMARFWFFSESARAAFRELLESQTFGRLLPREELEQLGIYFPDGRHGELIFLLHPGWLLARSDFNGPGWMPAGMHGYHPDDPHSDAIFLSNKRPPVEMSTIADIYRCMREA